METCTYPSADPHSEIHTVRPDGTGARRIRRFPRIAPNDCYVRYPSWAPDGRRLAYMSGDGIAVGPAARRDPARDRMVTSLGSWPAWSPDGRRIAFLRREPDVVNSLSVIGSNGGRARRLVRTNASLEWPSWSADGRHVLYSTNMVSDPGQIRMWRVSAAGGRPRFLGRGRSADASPDGRKIAFITGHAVWTMNPDGSGRRRIVRHSVRSMVWRLAWSPDGQRLAYIFYPVRTGTVSQVRIVRRDGSGRRVVDLPRRLDNPIYVHWGS